jgi:hypothetical protein
VQDFLFADSRSPEHKRALRRFFALNGVIVGLDGLAYKNELLELKRIFVRF